MADGVVVLDAWPIIEHYEGLEPAASAVTELMTGSGGRRIMSVVNFTEVCWAALDKGEIGDADRIARQLRRLVELESATSEIAEVAARLKYAYFMALGDTYAVATALGHNAPVWTGDAEILCGDRVWPVRDLRNADAWQRHEQRRLAGALRAGRRPAVASATDEQIADWLTAPLRRAVRRRAGSP